MYGKMIFMFLSPIRGVVEEFEGKFKHPVHKTWRRMCGWIDFKFYKTETKSENHEICCDIMISYVETLVINWEGFVKVVTYIG